MTNITYAHCDERIYLEISGHACPGEGDSYSMPEPEEMPVGEPALACAALSILVISITETLRRLESEGVFLASRMTVDSGYACFDLELDASDSERVCEILSPMISGFELLEENYPEMIRVS